MPTGPRVHVWRTEAGSTIAYGWQQNAWYFMHWPGLCTYRFASDDPHHIARPSDDLLLLVVLSND